MKCPAGVLVVVVALALILTGCGGDENGAESGDGDTTFLLASFTTLSEFRLDGARKMIAQAGAGAFIRYPAISPDSQTIAYSRQEAARTRPDGMLDFGADIYVVARTGGEPRLLVRHLKPGEFLGSPIFLKDGSSLLYSSRGLNDQSEPDLHIARMDLSLGTVKVVLPEATEPSISHDRSELVFVTLRSSLSSSELAISKVDGSELRVVIPDSAGLSNILSPVFSPDGKRIAFAAMQAEALSLPSGQPGAGAHPSTHDIWIVNRDGSNLTRFADIAEINPSLSWSGGGRALYVLGSAGIWQISASGKDVRRVGEGFANSQFTWLQD